MSIARVTAEVMMEARLEWASWVYCCGGGRRVESWFRIVATTDSMSALRFGGKAGR